LQSRTKIAHKALILSLSWTWCSTLLHPISTAL